MGCYDWGEVLEKELMDAVSVALEKGVTFFDTADVYGLGESEKILGTALRGYRTRAVIATKFGVRRDSAGRTFYDNSPNWINEALDNSLRRLKTDYIDLYQIHYRDNKTPLLEVINTLDINRAKGKIRYYGFSNISPQDVMQTPLSSEMVSFQLEYSLANRKHESSIRQICQTAPLEFISWGSLGQGILSGKYDRCVTFATNDRRRRPEYINFQGMNFEKNMKIVDKMRVVSGQLSKTIPQIAIRWILDYFKHGVVLTGVKRPEQILENLGAFGWNLAQQDIDELDWISR